MDIRLLKAYAHEIGKDRCARESGRYRSFRDWLVHLFQCQGDSAGSDAAV